MTREITIRGAVVQVDVTDQDLADARQFLLKFGTPGDGFFDAAAGSWVRAAEDRLTYPLPDYPSAQDRSVVRDRALIAAYADLLALTAGGAR